MYDFAELKHKNQKDDGGLSYFDTHILQVVKIIKQVTRDKEVIAAAYLHDTLEDTDTTLPELVEEFGLRVATLVNAVTHEGMKDTQGYWFPRLIPSLANRDAILIKFADRLSNLSRMESWTEDRQLHYLKKSQFWKVTP